MDSALTCCLCTFTGETEFHLESHIDYAHPDIFLSTAHTKVKAEPGTSSFGQSPVTSMTQEEYEVGKIRATYEQLLNQPGFR